MSASSAASSPYPTTVPETLIATRINVLERLLFREIVLHQSTQSMLRESQAYCKTWQHVYADAQSDLHNVQVQLSAVDLERLLHREIVLHQSTKSMLRGFQADCKTWQDAHAEAQNDLHHVQVQLSAADKAAREVLHENVRLNATIDRIVKAPLVSKSVR